MFYARYGAQNHNALATGHMGRGHYGLLLILDERAYFGILTWEQMLIQAKKDERWQRRNHGLRRKTRTRKNERTVLKGQNLSIYSIQWCQNVFLDSS